MTVLSLSDVLNELGQHTCYLDSESNEVDLVDANQLDWTGDSPLLIATRRGDLIAVDVLLRNGAGPNLQGERGLTALHYAAMFNNINITVLLLAHGADPKRADDSGRTAVDVANSYQATAVVKMLRCAKRS